MVGLLVWFNCLHLCFTRMCQESSHGSEWLFKSSSGEFEDSPVILDVDLPKWVNGVLYKNGAGLFEIMSSRQLHAFDGFGKVIRLDFSNGSKILKFTSKFLKSNVYNISMELGKIAPALQFGPRKPDFDHAEKVLALIQGADNLNVNVRCFGKWNFTCVALSDVWKFYEFDPRTLETTHEIHPKLHPEAKLKFSSVLNIPSISSAHPLPLHESEDYISVLWTVSLRSVFSKQFHRGYFNVVKLKNFTHSTVITTVKRECISYIHSFGLSKNYAVFFFDPLYIDVRKVMVNPTFSSSVEWKPKDATDVLVVDIHSGESKMYHLNKSYIHLHHVNTFEKDKYLYLDVVTYSNYSVFDTLFIKVATNASARKKYFEAPVLRRYQIDLGSNKIFEQPYRPSRLDALTTNIDFPAINENFRHVNNCYIYGVFRCPTGQSTLVKKDLCYGNDRIWHLRDHFVSEPVFVGRPGSQREDDGILISIVLNGKLHKSYVLVLDAQHLNALANGYFPVHIPFPIHGHFVPNPS